MFHTIPCVTIKTKVNEKEKEIKQRINKRKKKNYNDQ